MRYTDILLYFFIYMCVKVISLIYSSDSPTYHKYLLSAEWNRIFKQTPDNSLSTVGRSEGAIVAEVLGHVLLRRGKHLQGHTL